MGSLWSGHISFGLVSIPVVARVTIRTRPVPAALVPERRVLAMEVLRPFEALKKLLAGKRRFGAVRADAAGTTGTPDNVIDLMAGLTLRRRLGDLGLASFVKTTGGKGLHVVTPIVRGPDWETCAAVSRRIAQLMEAEEPESYVTTMSKKQRVGKIRLDTLRNARGATSVAAYSTRASASAPVSVPIAWDEVEDADPRHGSWTVRTLQERLTQARSDPWKAYASVRQRLTASLLRALLATNP